jgi:hypothetical protein
MATQKYVWDSATEAVARSIAKNYGWEPGPTAYRGTGTPEGENMKYWRIAETAIAVYKSAIEPLVVPPLIDKRLERIERILDELLPNFDKSEYEQCKDQLSSVCDILDSYLIKALGQGAAWENHTGTRLSPYSCAPALAEIWTLREDCNSTLHWAVEHENPQGEI